ncbi:MAG TPA: RlmE family RNA methyltransferase [Syntrophorhabdaceae bacterium]|nr:RlmE family RNA methyltransferase [Syntrophorhabdaceae bacterium]
MGKFVVKDRFYNKAKQEGFRARSAYKLKEIQDKFHLIKKGDKVLDLGCAPGSFLQILSGIIGERGHAFGVDILPTPPLPAANVSTTSADIRAVDVKNVLADLSLDHFDVITCDIAPNLSGIRDVDNANIENLFEAVLKIVREGVKPGGTFIFKSFFTGTLKNITVELQKVFGKVSLYKPTASRSASAEVYLICTGKK